MPTSRLEPVLFVPDVHRPYHDKTAWALMLKAAASFRPSHLVCLGDFVDFYSVSSHSKDPRRVRNLDEEIADAHVGLNQLDALGARHKSYIGGNHEDRLTRYLQDKAPELFGLVGIPELLKLKSRGWAYTPYKSATSIGKVALTHDVGNAGRQATFRTLDVFQHSVISAHAHRMQYIVEGDYKIGAMFGWLGDVEAVDYMQKIAVKRNWALGFGTGYLDTKTGIVYVVPVPIIPLKNGVYTCMVNGRLFEQAKVRG